MWTETLTSPFPSQNRSIAHVRERFDVFQWEKADRNERDFKQTGKDRDRNVSDALAQKGGRKIRKTPTTKAWKYTREATKSVPTAPTLVFFGAVLEHSLLSVRPAQCKNSYDAMCPTKKGLSRSFLFLFAAFTSPFPLTNFPHRHESGIFITFSFTRTIIKSRLVIRSLIWRRHHFGTSENFAIIVAVLVMFRWALGAVVLVHTRDVGTS